MLCVRGSFRHGVLCDRDRDEFAFEVLNWTVA